jgi:transcriptional regulator with XRE-family HTH domain
MEKLKDILKRNRLERKETLSTLSIKSGIAVAVLNKFEKGVRVPNRLQLEAISKALKIKGNDLKTVWLAEKILYEIGEDVDGLGALKLAESFYTYKLKKNDNIEVLLLEVDKLKKKLDKKRPLPKAQLKNLMGAFKIDYTYESNKIEGNTLTLQETAMVVDKGITIGGKSLNEHLEAINHSEAFDFVLELVKGKAEISEYNLLQLHAIIIKSIDK